MHHVSAEDSPYTPMGGFGRSPSPLRISVLRPHVLAGARYVLAWYVGATVAASAAITAVVRVYPTEPPNQEFWVQLTVRIDPTYRVVIASSDNAPLGDGDWLEGVYTFKDGELVAGPGVDSGN